MYRKWVLFEEKRKVIIELKLFIKIILSKIIILKGPARVFALHIADPRFHARITYDLPSMSEVIS